MDITQERVCTRVCTLQTLRKIYAGEHLNLSQFTISRIFPDRGGYRGTDSRLPVTLFGLRFERSGTDISHTLSCYFPNVIGLGQWIVRFVMRLVNRKHRTERFNTNARVVTPLIITHPHVDLCSSLEHKLRFSDCLFILSANRLPCWQRLFTLTPPTSVLLMYLILQKTLAKHQFQWHRCTLSVNSIYC